MTSCCGGFDHIGTRSHCSSDLPIGLPNQRLWRMGFRLPLTGRVYQEKQVRLAIEEVQE